MFALYTYVNHELGNYSGYVWKQCCFDSCERIDCINHNVCNVTKYDTDTHHNKPHNHHNFVFLECMVAVDFVYYFPDIEAVLHCSSIL